MPSARAAIHSSFWSRQPVRVRDPPTDSASVGTVWRAPATRASSATVWWWKSCLMPICKPAALARLMIRMPRIESPPRSKKLSSILTPLNSEPPPRSSPGPSRQECAAQRTKPRVPVRELHPTAHEPSRQRFAIYLPIRRQGQRSHLHDADGTIYSGSFRFRNSRNSTEVLRPPEGFLLNARG